ncbi:MAG: RecQ family ATP-dependent DNA helicase [Cellvibrio sp.]|uniref:RecQ family ATP-dependent DNA helicase n=1 Tax=Cellvibrio sp. TaxID=1965322 RepID=UPI0031A91FD1
MDTALTLLQHRFNLPAFRPGQEAVINALLQGQSALAVFPTGGGKSLCYQLPALMFDGLTLVVSPLIALMKDQVDALQALGIAAARLDSSLGKDETAAIYDALHNRSLKLLYVSPERLKNERFVQRLGQLKISLLAIDEAHCISEWGHNFRPDYLLLADLAKKLRVERVLALTATATPGVAADICRQFAIQLRHHIQTSFARPNLQLRVTPCTADTRMDVLLARLHKHPRDAATIVYVTLQKTAEDVAAAINAAGLRAAHYHAGLKDDEREQVQNQFMNGEVPVVVATIAFGMGIDKSNIRAVYHFNLPKSIENYVQEIGRAGRDGNPSLCEMLAVGDDIRVLENFTYGDTPTAESLRALVEYLLAFDDVFDISTYELSQQFDLRPLVLNTALTYLELQNVISAQSPFYIEYKIQFVQDKNFILAQFDEARAEFLQRLFSAGRMGRKWLSLDMLTIAMQLGEPKERITKALDYMAEKGWIELTVANLRLGYLNNKTINSAEQLTQLCAHLNQLFAEREARDIKRIHSVLGFANNPACLSQQLMQYFGETEAQACGICNHCRSNLFVPINLPAAVSLTPAQQNVIANVQREEHAVLRQPRQLARFLCGLPSPATSRSTLKSNPAFGALAEVAFAVILAASHRQ